MSKRLPIEIYPYRLIEQRRILNGRLNLKPLSRLQELTHHSDGYITVEMTFGRTDTGLPMISSSLNGSVPLLCQRCMHTVDHVFDKTWQLILVNSDAEAALLSTDDEAWIVEDDKIFIQDFIEDELLLSLPVVAKHKQCDVDAAAQRASFKPETPQRARKTETKNPFASLKKIFKDK